MKYGIGDIFNLFSSGLEKLRTGVVGIGSILRNLSGSLTAFVASVAVIGKAGYDKLIIYINSFMAELEGLSLESLSSGWEGMSFIAFANYIFPLSELLAGLIIIAEFWVFCLVFKLNWHFRRQIRLGT